MGHDVTDNVEADGWAWLDSQEPQLANTDDSELVRSFARCFRGSEGQHVLRHLQRTILERRLGPKASDAELRFLEGQRSVAAHIVSMVVRGQS